MHIVYNRCKLHEYESQQILFRCVFLLMQVPDFLSVSLGHLLNPEEEDTLNSMNIYNNAFVTVITDKKGRIFMSSNLCMCM